MQIPVDFLIIQPLRLHGCYKKGKLGVVIQFIYLSFDPYGLHDYRIIKAKYDVKTSRDQVFA